MTYPGTHRPLTDELFDDTHRWAVSEAFRLHGTDLAREVAMSLALFAGSTRGRAHAGVFLAAFASTCAALDREAGDLCRELGRVAEQWWADPAHDRWGTCYGAPWSQVGAQ
ncbi:hypothetical protein [Cellulomonas sp. RIT-PI-Y]|uniref:hypothetical protein n=1 Tax=Cellulomonas sp. RIT-PI-Y TaxID=3035297 RepID=UPI0021D9AB73|nr:hypothetical protein [Cellulomonas sp. RIT-PI-Y]